MQTLKPCPFCGASDVKLIRRKLSEMSWVSCNACGLDAPSETGDTNEKAVAYWNTRPAEPVEGLETVETQWQRDGENSWHNEKYEFRPSGKTKTRKLVDRSDVEALINYERKQATAAHDADAKAFLSAYNRATELEADNAALTERVKELEVDVKREASLATSYAEDRNEEQRRRKALETQLEAARDVVSRAQEIIPDSYINWHDFARAALEAKP